MVNGKWSAAYFCVSCEQEMSYKAKMLSNGVCPHCGTGWGSTIVCTTEKIFRNVRISAWWQFWLPSFKREFKEQLWAL